ncbi:unnamed protein product [Blepharisma stoltei]|uniref:Superoxide dismutase n=1 Tax=Blepharisma stoltei TaxID=1481888 RepID=A0AAU9JYM1_9CILI|nr:unnamed protein product [Blepharisma stoltei]
MTLKRIALFLLTLSSAATSCDKDEYSALNEKGEFTLPKLPYQYGYLQPQYWSQLLYYHHVKVHQQLIDQLNSYISTNSTYTSLTLTDLLIQYGTTDSNISRYAGGHYNHSLLWWILLNSRCGSSDEPNDNLGLDIESQYGSFSNFQTDFSNAAKNLFGSGWVWACVKSGSIQIKTNSDESSPLAGGDCYPFLGIDVWEHAYYFYYEWDREEYIDSWWEIIDWNMVEMFYEDYALEGKAVSV